MTPAQILAKRILARRRLIPYIQGQQPEYHAGWVHHDIAKRLEKFYQDVVDKKSPRLMLNMPPRAGKSVTASCHFPAWVMGQNPKIDIILASYNIDLPIGFSRKIRATIRDNEEYHLLFPDTRLSRDSQAAESWMTEEGGSFVATGIGGPLTGRGAHVLIIDDYIKNAEEAENNELHRKHLDWYQSTAYTRLAPGGGVLIIATRWSYSDLSGQLQQLSRTDPEADRFELIEYPAISERYEYRHRYTNEMRREVDEILLDLQATNQDWELLRSPMEPLHPERFSIDMLRRIKANLSNRIWSALYQQRPVPDEGLFFQKAYIKYMAALPAFSQANMYTALDFAISTKDANDYTALATGVQDSSALLIVENVTHFKRDTFSIVEAIINEAERVQNTYPYYNYEVGFENGAIFQTLEPVLKRRMLERRIFFTYRTLQPLTDKQARARPLQSLMEQERVYFLESISQLAEAVSELLQFPVGRNDDMVDALAWMARMSLNKSPPRDDTEQHRNKEKSWKDKLRAIMHGKSTSYMGA